MEVTKSSLNAFLPQIEEAIEESNFIAIDTELTGLNSENSQHQFDTLEERYVKLKEGCEKFLVIQFGLSAFRYHPDKRKYTHKDFNFYVFPRPYSKQAPDQCFLCQSSSINYLVQYEFDFNKLFREGIPYLNPHQEEKIKAQLAERHKDQLESLSPSKNGNQKTRDQKHMNIPDGQRPFLDDIHEKIESLLNNGSEKELELPTCNSYQRKLIYQSVNSRYSTGLDFSTKLNEKNESYIKVVKATEEEKRSLLQERQIADLDELSEAVGFRKVLELITKSKKLVVGHNMLLDMMHIINQFYHPLPESLQDFRDLVKMYFPHVLDTKTMSSLPPFKEYFTNTALGNLLDQLQNKAFGLPKFEPADGFKGYELYEKREHEAGYDAFITGLCFIGLSKRLAFNTKSSDETVPVNSKHLRPFVNRLFIMRNWDITCLNLNSPDPEPNREHVFYVTFPREWRSADLIELFAIHGPINVSWLSENSALVGLRNPKNKHYVFKTLVNRESSLYKVRPYSEYVEMQKTTRTQPAGDNRRHSITPQADPALPNKRRRSSGSSENQSSKRSIEPIPEEEEEDKELSDSNRGSLGSSPYPVPDDCIDEPGAKRKKMCNKESSPKSNQCEKVFEEPDTW